MNKRIKTLLKQGDFCEIRLSPSEEALRAELEKVLDSDKLLVFISKAAYEPPIFDEIEVALFHGRVGVIKYHAKVEAYDFTEEGFYLQITVQDEVDAIQRREFYRLSTIKNVNVVTKERHIFDGFTENISAGGAKCFFKEPIEEGADVGFKMVIEEEAYLVKGQVLECIPCESKNYQIRIQFKNLSDREQARLLSYILKEESKQAAKFRN